ncbi:MAG: hypothetical protein ACI8PZ_000232 [Myxococcota bacterium]
MRVFSLRPRWAVAVLPLLAACARAPVQPAGSPDAHVDDALQVNAPAPFSSDEIRDAMPVGTHLRIRNTAPDGVTVADWFVTAADRDGVDIRYTIEDASGAVLKGPTEQRDTWTTLRDHALFPASATLIDEDDVEVPAGSWRALRYVVTRERSGAQVTDTFWFAPELPGPPVRFVSRAGDQEVFRMELLLRE